jgi:osmotically inducible lipoprotein OsmB
MSKLKVFVAAVLLFGLAGCGHSMGDRALSGGAIGAGGGAVAGAVLGNPLAGALVGGAAGAGIGAATADEHHHR